MGTIRDGEAKPLFESAIVLSREGVEAAKQFIMDRVGPDPTDGLTLIRAWWVDRKAPPVPQLILNDDYDYPDQCERAGRHWVARLSAARALSELVAEDYLESAVESTQTEEVQQAHTTVVERSGGNSGGWHLQNLAVRFPSRVRRGPFSKKWTVPVSTSFSIPIENVGPRASATLSEAFAEPSWRPLSRRPIGELHDTSWYDELPAGLPHIVRTAAARQKASDDLRGVADALMEAAPNASPLERRIAEFVRDTLDNMVDLLLLNEAGDWAATEDQAVPMTSHMLSWLIAMTRIVEGVVGWADAVELLKTALRALGVDIP